jgi:hypothetical protein
MVERSRSGILQCGSSTRLLNSSSHHSSAASHQKQQEINNPITTDAELNILVHSKLDHITKYKTFTRWKGKFLHRFETFLYQRGMDPAQREADTLQLTLNKLCQQSSKVLHYIDQGDLTVQRKTVKAALAVNEMCKTLEQARLELEGLIPSGREERRLGYTKFHLGAILIQQNFPQYVAMKQIEADLQAIVQKTTMMEDDVLDRQQHDCFNHYLKQVIRFCDIMADLDMYEIMKKCIQFRNPPEESESEDPEEMEIHIHNLDTNDHLSIEMLDTDTIALLQGKVINIHSYSVNEILSFLWERCLTEGLVISLSSLFSFSFRYDCDWIRKFAISPTSPNVPGQDGE